MRVGHGLGGDLLNAEPRHTNSEGGIGSVYGDVLWVLPPIEFVVPVSTRTSRAGPRS